MNKLISKRTEVFENHLDETEARWFALFTNHRREKIATRYLSAQGIHTYLPLQKHTRRYSRKVKEVELPLITHYTFCENHQTSICTGIGMPLCRPICENCKKFIVYT